MLGDTATVNRWTRVESVKGIYYACLTGFVGVWWRLMRGNDVQKGGKCDGPFENVQ
jgi:hypothetical protein